jgi:PAS domain S-box-containing protein
MAARREAETQLKSLVESSPAAILTLTSDGTIEMANEAAHELFGVKRGELARRPVRDFMPVLAGLLEEAPSPSPYRTATNCRALRADGTLFLACVWFSTYQTRSGPRLSAIVTDASDDLRDYQESSLRSLLRSTRVLVGSVSHEIRNMCAAIGVVHANLGRIGNVRETEDYKALGTLSSGLTRLTKVELQTSRDEELGSVRLKELFEEFRIVVQPSLDVSSIGLTMSEMSNLPNVSAERHGLLQVFLNLARNSERAMERSEERRIDITAAQTTDYVLVRFSDSGPGVEHPERLFQPFQTGADASGLGLFVSRAIIRGFGGEMYHDPEEAVGCTMCIRLRIVQHGEVEPDLISTEETS